MYIDAQQQFSQAQALTVTAVSTNAIDLSQDRNIGIGYPMAVLLTVGVAAGGTGATVVVTVQADTTSAFGSPVIAATSNTLTQAQMTLGSKFVIPLPPDLLTARWMRLNYTLAGTSPTVTVTAELIPQLWIQNEVYYPAGVTIQ